MMMPLLNLGPSLLLNNSALPLLRTPVCLKAFFLVEPWESQLLQALSGAMETNLGPNFRETWVSHLQQQGFSCVYVVES